MSKKRSRKEAELDEIPRKASTKIARGDKSKDPLSNASKCQELFKALETQLSKSCVDTDSGGGYGKESIKLCKNVKKGLDDSKFLKNLKDAISSSISGKTEELLVNDIISYLYDSRLIQLFEYFINNKMTFDLNDEYTYKDLMNHELLYYLSRHEVQSNFEFEEDTKKLMTDIDECKSKPCVQICTNLKGTWACGCKPGYVKTDTRYPRDRRCSGRCEQFNQCLVFEISV